MILKQSVVGKLAPLATVIAIFAGCQPSAEKPTSAEPSASSAQQISLQVTKSAEPQSQSKPNILWLVVEDMSPILPDFGDNTIATPHISSLAKEGVKYTNVYSTSGVCAPSRAALATGMYPSAFGANHMRTTSNTEQTGLPKYAAVPPAQAKMLSQYMREQGYYASNNLKTDYQFKAPRNAWDESGPYAHWRNRKNDQPFYAVVNFTTTHESGLFEPYGVRYIESRHYFADDAARIAALPQHHSQKTQGDETPIHIDKNLAFEIPPYLPDTPVVRRDMWKMYNNLAETDRQIGAVLAQLKQDGLYDSTIIVFYADHGGPLPRQKRLIYDSGLKVPMIIRYPGGKGAGSVDSQLISFVDFAPTTLDMAKVTIPAHMQGQSFIDDHKRKYIHAAGDRFDGYTDAIRAVKDARFKYIRNYRPEQGYYLPLAYREKIPTMQELLKMRDQGRLNPAQAQWFRASKPLDELFDTLNDPHELVNLADDPAQANKLAELQSEMDQWLSAIGDQPNQPESELIQRLWQGSETKPVTAPATIRVAGGSAEISSDTPGASISYKIITDRYEPATWQIYQGPFAVEQGQSIQAVAHRIGFTESGMVFEQIK